MEDEITHFISITDCTRQKAESYLKVSDYDLPQALQLFFDTGGADMEASAASPPPTRPHFSTAQIGEDSVDIDIEDEDMLEAMRASGHSPPAPSAGGGPVFEDDEAMARRLQEELYGSARGEASDVENGVRAPIAKTRETLVEDDFEYPPPRPARGGQ